MDIDCALFYSAADRVAAAGETLSFEPIVLMET